MTYHDPFRGTGTTPEAKKAELLRMTPAQHIDKAAETMAKDVDPGSAHLMWASAQTHLLMAVAKQLTKPGGQH